MTQYPTQDLSDFLGDDRFATIMADPPWRFVNRTGKVAPEHGCSAYPHRTKARSGVATPIPSPGEEP